MNRKNFIITLIIILLTAVLPALGTETSNTIKALNGVKTIDNHFPSKGTVTLDLKKSLSIDPSKYSQCADSIITDFVVDKTGNIYLLDGARVRIHKFSPIGKYLTSFLERNEGPGGHNQYPKIEIANNLIWVFSEKRLSSFNLDGKLQKDFKLIKFYYSPLIIGNNQFIANYEIFQDSIHFTKFAALIDLGNESKPANFFSADNVGRIFVPYMGGQASVRFVPGVLPDIILGYNSHLKRVYASLNSKYEIDVFNLSGGKESVIRCDSTPVNITEEDKKAMISEMGKIPPEFPKEINDRLPKSFCAIEKIDALNNGAIITRYVNGYKQYAFDVFDKDGKWLYRFTLPGNLKYTLLRFANGNLCGIEELEDRNVYFQYKSKLLQEIF